MILDELGNVRVVGFGRGADAVWQVLDRALDPVVIDEQLVDVGELRHGCVVMRHARAVHHAHHARTHPVHHAGTAMLHGIGFGVCDGQTGGCGDENAGGGDFPGT
jgi:hypothetical protein